MLERFSMVKRSSLPFFMLELGGTLSLPMLAFLANSQTPSPCATWSLFQFRLVLWLVIQNYLVLKICFGDFSNVVGNLFYDFRGNERDKRRRCGKILLCIVAFNSGGGGALASP